MTDERLIKRLKSGDIITVRAKNGDCIPMFSGEPAAYRCIIGKTSISGDVVWRLMKRRLIVPVDQGWYTEGHFRFNSDLRDDRGRFRPR